MTEKTILVRIGQDEAPLDALRGMNIEVPGWCNGMGICGLCRVRVLGGDEPLPSCRDRALLSAEELASGWRLACQLPPGAYELDRVQHGVLQIITEPPNEIIEPSLWPGREGPGIAFDLGTTSVMATVMNEKGDPGPVSIARNRQVVYGENVIDRLTAAHDPLHHRAMRELAVQSLTSVLSAQHERGFAWMSIVGNSAMHHLLAGLNVSTLSTSPYVPAADGFAWRDISFSTGWAETEITAVLVPPLGGFVGSDTLASVALVQTRFPGRVWMLIDVGTNCEVVLHQGDEMFYSSAPAGPAFEGGHLSCGMMVGPGAVKRISDSDGEISWRVQGNGAPAGLSGPAAVDFAAVLRREERLHESGRFAGSEGEAVLPDAEAVRLSQLDIRELQKAKGAVEFCMRGVLNAAKLATSDIDRIVVAGGFGKALDVGNAQEIGLLPSVDRRRIVCGGNLALLGGGLVLDKDVVEDIRKRSRRVLLHGRNSGEEYAAALALRPWVS